MAIFRAPLDGGGIITEGTDLGGGGGIRLPSLPITRPTLSPSGPSTSPVVKVPATVPSSPTPTTDYQGFGPKLPLSDAGGGTTSPAPTPTRTIAPPSTARDTGAPSSGLAAFVPGGVYSSHGAPAGLTCPVGQVPTEVPAGSGFWRCAPGSGPNASPSGLPVTPSSTPVTTAPASPTSGPTAPTGTPDSSINRLIDLVAAQYAGAGVKGGDSGGLTAIPVGTAEPGAPAPASSGKGAAIFILVLLVAGIGYFWYKHKHKKAA